MDVVRGDSMKRYRIITDSMTPEPTTYEEMIDNVVDCETLTAREHIKELEHEIIDIKFTALYEQGDTEQLNKLEQIKHDWQRVIETLNNLRGEEND